MMKVRIETEIKLATGRSWKRLPDAGFNFYKKASGQKFGCYKK
jgi:hypothetical protein